MCARARGLNMVYVVPLSEELTLENGGGKAVNLSILYRKGFNVPQGFIITTNSYRDFVKSNKLAEIIKKEITAAGNDFESYQTASQTIRESFRSCIMPRDIEEPIIRAFISMNTENVAVRSSATAEDLPEASFAGQQDTFLNVTAPELLRSVIECWSSLWTSRAIQYRKRNEIDQMAVSIAVVVQEMVDSHTSGVLFTANPVTGNRTETVIDATFGLGEQLVSGKVEPDNYVVDNHSMSIKSIHIGSKGGVEEQALNEKQILKLSQTGQSIHALYGSPQDIEWAFSQDEISVLQSRPITGLYPLLENIEFEPFRVFGSFSHLQGVMSPITPMGLDVLLLFISNTAKSIRIKLDPERNTVLGQAGGRLFINITGLLQNRKYHGLAETVLINVEPEMKAIFTEIKDDPRITKVDRMPTLSTILKILSFFPLLAFRAVFSVLTPESSRENVNAKINRLLDEMHDLQNEAKTPAERIEFINTVFKSIANILFPTVLPRVVAGIGSFMLLKRRAESMGLNLDALNIARGLPHNVTTQMDLTIWENVKRVQIDPGSRQALSRPVEEVITDYQEKRLPAILSEVLDSFLVQYGMRGVGEIDVGAPRWYDDPTQIIQAMQSYLDIIDPELAPDIVFQKGFKSAEESRVRIVEAARKNRGWLYGKTTELACNSHYNLAGLRETPKFFIIRLFDMVKVSLLSIGESLSARGIISEPGDVFYLKFKEMQETLNTDQFFIQQVIKRKRAYAYERHRHHIPRLITSEGDVYINSKQSSSSGIKGTPVSPGTIEGSVRVLTSPTSDKLYLGEILVCPGTDPSWTPLFLVARGLVMEVGGLMTHGSVVAREYSIPAVVGVRDATTRLKTGQRIRVDGETGRISILTQEDP